MSENESRVLVLIADGTEEMEAVIVIDVLRRGDVEVVVAGVDGPQAVICSRGVVLTPDAALEAVAGQEFSWVVLPGGAGGSERFAQSEAVGALLRAQRERRQGVAAICAAPAALAVHGLDGGRPMTSHPGVEDVVAAHGAYSSESVVDDGDLITSRGPGTAFPFAFSLLSRVAGLEKAAEVRAPMAFGD